MNIHILACIQTIPGADYVSRTNFAVAFSAGAFSSTVRINILNDDITEMPESFRVVLSSTNPGVIITSGRESTEVTILDTDGNNALEPLGHHETSDCMKEG